LGRRLASRPKRPGEPLGHEVGVAALGSEVKQFFKAAAVLGVPGQAAKIVHAADCISLLRFQVNADMPRFSHN
jgi:hypothetical protein